MNTKTKKYAWLAKFLPPALLSIVTFFVYYPSLRYIFMFDDFPTIVNYIHIKIFDPVGQFFANSRWVSRVLNQFTYHYWKIDPFAYRLIDLFMHIAIGVMIFFTLTKLFVDSKKNQFLKQHAYAIATLAAGLFLLHPVQTQTVTYITQMRLEGLVMFFVFAVLTTFVYAVKAKNKNVQLGLYGLSLVLTALSAGTKEIIVALPVFLILVDWFFIAQGEWADFKKRILIHGLYFIVLYSLLVKFGLVTPAYVTSIATNDLHNNRGNVLTSAPSVPITMYPFFISQFKVLLHYIAIFFWPFTLSFDYEMKLSKSIFGLDVIVPFLLLMLLGYGLLRLLLKNKAHPLVFGFLWFFAGMLPRTSIFPSTELICDYKTYVPSFGLLFFIAIGMVYLIDLLKKNQEFLRITGNHTARYQLGMLALFLVSIGYATSERNLVWSSEYLFWQDVIHKAPNKARGHNNYAIAVWEQGKREEAFIHFKRSIELDDWYGEPHVNLASMYQGQGDVKKAMEHYQRAMDIGEAHPEMFHNLALLHMTQKSYAGAEHCFREAIRYRPYYSRAYVNLAKLYQLQQRFDRALACYEKAMRGDVQDNDLYYSHGLLCHDMNKIDDALASLQKLDGRYQNTEFLIGSCFYNKRNYAQAAKHFGLAYKHDSKNMICAYNYAQSLLNTGNYAQALPVFQLCVSLSDEYPYAALHAVKCQYELGNKQEAKKSLNQLIKQTKYDWVKRDGVSLGKELKLT